MNKIIPSLFLIIFISACTPKPQTLEVQDTLAAKPDNSNAEPDNAKPDNAKPDNAKPDNAKPNNAEPDKLIDFPKLDAELKNEDSMKDEKGNYIEAFYYADTSETGKREKLESQILDSGFQKIQSDTNDIYEKVQNDQLVIINLAEGEGELNIRMYRTRDPDKRYVKADPRIPYPLKDGFAAEYADIVIGIDNDPIYTFYNCSHDFLDNYEKRLLADGFIKVRDGNSPLYNKVLSDKTELSVVISKLNDKGSDLRIALIAPKTD